MSTSRKKIIIILGPTASGKSSMAHQIAKEVSGFLISADSRQIYKEMDIITGKDKGHWKNGKYMVDGIYEYMVDIIEPTRDFSVYDYQSQVFDIIDKADENLVPIIVGGTGLYISSIVDNYELPPGKADDTLREKLTEEMERKGKERMFNKLLQLDPDAISYVDANNPRKIIRALEVSISTGMPFTQQMNQGQQRYDILQIGIKIEREVLYKQINKRIDNMLEHGGWQEVKEINNKYSNSFNSTSGIGYKQLAQYLDGQISKEEAIELFKRDTRHYAKRQVTWFARDKRINWVSDISETKNLIKDFLYGKDSE